MLSDLLVHTSRSPPSSRHQAIGISSNDSKTLEHQNLFQLSPNNIRRTRPTHVLSSHERTQSLSRQENYGRLRHYPKTLEIFIPFKNHENHTNEQKITRTYEYEIEERRRSSSAHNTNRIHQQSNIERQYIHCMDELTRELEKRYQHHHDYQIKDQYEKFQQSHRSPQTTNQYRTDDQIQYQRSLSENLLHQRSKPMITKSINISDENLSKMEYRLQPKDRYTSIHIHSSNNSIPGDTSIKYVRADRSPVEIRLPKPQIFTQQGTHSSTVVKDIRQPIRKITTNIHQTQRRRTIEGQHDLRIIETPMNAGHTRPVEFTVPKPTESTPIEHSSTLLVNSRKGGRFQTLDTSSSLTRPRTLSGEHELRVIPEPIRSNNINRPVELRFPKAIIPAPTTHHSSTIVKQARTPPSSLVLDHIRTKLKGEHELRIVNKPIESGPGDGIELIVPKRVTDQSEHTSTVLTETRPSRRVLEITGSGKRMKSEHERKFYSDRVRVEEEIEVKLPKTKLEQIEHSTTIVKHSRGHQPVIEIDTTGKKIAGDHQTKIIQKAVETVAEAMQLIVAKPKPPSEHSTTIIKSPRTRTETVAIGKKPLIPGKLNYLL